MTLESRRRIGEVTSLVLIPPMFIGAGAAELVEGHIFVAALLTYGGFGLHWLAMKVKPRGRVAER